MPGENDLKRHLAVVAAAVLFGAGIGGAPALQVTAAPVRRALLIGIDTYLPPPAGVKARVNSLNGAVNDVEAMRAVLIARYGFTADNVRVIKNTEATRDRILADIRSWLVRTPARGDISLFFFAGHGSQARNSKSPELDGMDETIVPTEANRGRPDIRDKELKQLFNEALDRGIAVTAIFDSCHSGSIARGLWTPRSVRFATPDLRDVADGEIPPEPEARGALILSAAQDHQLTDEVVVDEEGGAIRGVFTWALVKSLRTMPVADAADRMFLRVRGLMQTVSSAQEPVLAASPERRRAALFGPGPPVPSGVVVAVQALTSDGLVRLQGGLAAGLRAGAELRPANGEDAPTLRVVRDEGLSSSLAQAVSGSAAKVEPGALYAVTRWAPAAGRPLRLWIRPSRLTAPEVAAEARAVAAIAPEPQLDWVVDPVGRPSLSFVQRTDSGWQVLTSERPAVAIGATAPAPSRLAPLLPLAGSGASPVMADLPISREAGDALRTAASGDPLVLVQTSPQGADYMLVGRVLNGGVEYAWVRPRVVDLDASRSIMPAHTEWVPAGRDPAALAARLRDLADRLSVVKNWLELESPADPGTFPYRLSLRHVATGALKVDGAATSGEPYELFLIRNARLDTPRIDRRYVYVFAIDQDGKSLLLFPDAAAGNVEHRFPLNVETTAALPGEIPLRSRRTPFQFTAGLDTFVLLTTAAALPDPGALEGEAVRPASSRGLLDPLTALLAQGASRGLAITTPVEWSIERFTIRTLK